MKNKMMKCVVTGIMTAVILVSGIVISPKDAKEAKAVALTEDKVFYDELTGKDFKELYVAQNKTAPTKEGYLFAGWYLGEGTDVVTTNTDLDAIKDGDKIYAKFVPSYVLSVKSQNYVGTAASENGIPSADNKTKTRVVSSVDDSLLYSKVGFTGTINNKTFDIESTKVWDTLSVNGKEYGPKKVFGETSKYFFILNIQNIPETEWAKQMYVRPYWITEDGTKVEGLGKYVYVEDGLKNYISVPVNLNNVTEGIAAGVLKVSYDKSRLKFVESIDGRVFDDMKISAHEDSKIACVGNVSTLQDVTKDDMYITLRFEVTDGISLEDRDALYQFAISAEDFANVNEDDVNLTVWDVQY